MKTIKDVLLVLAKQLKWIILSTIIAGVIATIYTIVFVEPIYSSSASVYVINNATKDNDTISTSEISASQQLVKTYIVVLESDTTLEKVSKQLENLGYYFSVKQLRNMIYANSINSTEAFSITTKGPDSEIVRIITSTVLDVLPDEIIRVVGAGTVNIIDNATYPDEPVYPIANNICYGMVFGMIVAIAIVVLHAAFDTKVHSEAQLKEEFDIAIIGRIPNYLGNADIKELDIRGEKRTSKHSHKTKKENGKETGAKEENCDSIGHKYELFSVDENGNNIYKCTVCGKRYVEYLEERYSLTRTYLQYNNDTGFYSFLFSLEGNLGESQMMRAEVTLSLVEDGKDGVGKEIFYEIYAVEYSDYYSWTTEGNDEEWIGAEIIIANTCNSNLTGTLWYTIALFNGQSFDGEICLEDGVQVW